MGYGLNFRIMKEREEKEELLKNFMQEFFDFEGLKNIGFFTKEMEEDYEAQADRVCKFFGLKTIYEYGLMEATCHISHEEGHQTKGVNDKGKLEVKPFIERITNIYK
jgi:hypothetical protein